MLQNMLQVGIGSVFGEEIKYSGRAVEYNSGRFRKCLSNYINYMAGNLSKEGFESGENILETAKRELKEETFGMLFIAEIYSFEEELHSEMEKIIITDSLGKS